MILQIDTDFDNIEQQDSLETQSQKRNFWIYYIKNCSDSFGRGVTVKRLEKLYDKLDKNFWDKVDLNIAELKNENIEKYNQLITWISTYTYSLLVQLGKIKVK